MHNFQQIGESIIISCRGEKKMDKNNRQHEEPNIAPAMQTHDELEEKATKKEVKDGDSTQVTRLYLDRTPED